MTFSLDDGIVVAYPARRSPSALAGHAAIRGCAVQKEESAMPRQTVESRVEALDTRVTMLEELPARMDRLESQIVQLRAENSADHSAIRQEIQALGTELRGEMKMLGGEVGELRTTMEMLHHRQGIEMRVLFEDALSRIAAMNDARPGARDGNA